ncbi:hypothetical protein ACIP5Y_19215 [Nocardia sp. NPDC088792]|uniref:hypothetical protein n=1 Tax=Nocardia sp. NPDC088792 TaxID=3364332 RepID=UPI003814A3A6
MTVPSQGSAIPQAGQWRLHHSLQQGAAATSFLGHSSFLLWDQMGFEPVGAVIGMSVVHIGGLQVTGWKTPRELDTYSGAIMLGIDNALHRLRDEAAMLGADGIHLKTMVQRSNLGGEEHEYQVSGTALRFRPQPGALRARDGGPFVNTAAVTALYQMMKRGWLPSTIGYGACVYHIPHRTMRQSMTQTFQNVEIPVFTESWYTAREIALGRMQSSVEKSGSELVLNVSLEEQSGVHGEHAILFLAEGNGWARRDNLAQLIPEVDLTVASLTDNEVMMTAPYPRAHP